MKTAKKTEKKITSLTQEQTALLSTVRDEWIANALRCGRATPEERSAIVANVVEMYRLAGLKAPRVVIVPSPLMMARVGGAASWWWHRRGSAAHARSATDAATYAATSAATAEATYAATDAATAAATAAAAACASRWWDTSQGGHLWSGWCAFLDFWRRVMRTERPDMEDAMSRADFWIALARISGYRWMHAEFCIVSERPIKLATELVRGVHVPHCEDGPSHLWGDGFAIWHWHGVRVPQHVIESPEKITLAEIAAEANAEVRRVMRDRYGIARYLKDTGAKLVHADYEVARKGAAPRALLEDADGNRWLVGTDGSTGRVYYMMAPQDAKTCRDAHVALCGFDESRIINKS